MKNLIIDRIKALHEDKKESHVLPSDPNELELKKDICNLLNTELDSLIDEGIVTITGKTINKHRILKIK